MKNCLKAMIFSMMLIIPVKGFSQYWMQRAGGVAVDEATAIASDAASSTYTTGYFSFTAFFETNSIASSGLEDIFIVKNNADGSIAWVKKAGGTDIDRALSIATTNNGSFIITGYFFGTATFGTQSITSAGQKDMFVAKYDTTGVLQWVVRAGGIGAEAGNAVAVDAAGNIIVTGEFAGTSNFGTSTLTSLNNSIDVFAAKYDSNGNLLWAKQGSGNFTDRGTAIATDAASNIYVMGNFSDTITFDQVHNNAAFSSVFIIKFNTAGQEQWFRWVASATLAEAGGIAVHGIHVNVTGDFLNSLNFYGGTGAPTLVSAFTNNVFVCRYDTSGNVLWAQKDGSVNPVNSQSVTTTATGEVIIGGNFKCRFDDISAQFGSGTFCSIGYWDNYVSSYDNSGNRKWARNYGGHENDFTYGITFKPNGCVATCGSFYEKLFSTYTPSTFIPHGAASVDYGFINSGNSTYCSDSSYKYFYYLKSFGNSDVFINANIDTARQPYDFFKRQGVTCNRPYFDTCIKLYPPGNACPDTITVCGGAGLVADMNNFYDPTLPEQLTPLYHFTWSNGDTIMFSGFNNTGYISVQVSTYDGCFGNTDSAYIVNNALPVDATITDSKGINVNATAPIDIPLCIQPDSVTLACTNVGTNTVQWTGFAAGVNPVTYSNPGTYYCTLTNGVGCTSQAEIKVVTGSPLPPVLPQMICMSDTNFNDTLTLCQNSSFYMFVFDTLTNAGPLTDTLCIPGMTGISWSTTMDTHVQYNSVGTCPNGVKGYFTCTTVDTFDIDITAIVYRENPCYSDSFIVHKQLHVIVIPSPTGSVTFSVTGPQYICPGTPAILVATPPGYSYSWTNGTIGDSTVITQPGTYGAIGQEVLTNAYGCSATITAYHTITVQPYPQPGLTMQPINGVICPGDSVYLIPTSSGTVLYWQGPNGTFGSNEQNVFVYTPGTYYYIMEIVPGCNYVSGSVQLTNYSTPTSTTIPGTSLCLTDSITLQIISDPLGSIIQWDAPFFDFGFSHVVDSPGTYTCTVEQCYIFTPFIFVITEDTATAFIYSTPSTNSVCSGDSVLLTANSGMAYYQWLPPSIINDSIYVSQPGLYSLIATSAGGCTDTAQVTINVTPNNLSPPAVNDTTICPNYPVQLQATSTDSVYWSSAFNYASIFNTGNTWQTQPLNSPVTYYLFTQQGLCRSTIDSLTVNISTDTVNAVIYSTAAGNTICSGDSILLTTGGGIAGYQWLPAGITGDSLYVSQTGNYTLVATSQSGCSDTTYLTVTVVPNTLLPPLVNDTAICPGTTTLVLAISTDTVYWSSLPTYTNVFNNGSSWQSPPLQSAVTYYVFTAAGICRSSIDSVTIAVTADTASAFINTPQGSTFCVGDSVLLLAFGGTTYQWLPIAAINDSIYANGTDTYTLIATSTSGCNDTTTITLQATANNLLPPSSENATICTNTIAVLNAMAATPVYWALTPDYNSILFEGNTYTTPVLQNTTAYYLYTSDGVCKSSIDSVYVAVEICDTIQATDVFLPNVFTPNNDGINDYYPGNLKVHYTLSLTVYNRWGMLVYHGNNLELGWDGKLSNGLPAAAGTYYCIAEFTLSNGIFKRLTGSFLLVRE